MEENQEESRIFQRSILSEQLPVDLAIDILPNIKNNLDLAVVFFAVFPYGLYRDLRCTPVREQKTPVEMQQNAMLFRPFSSASFRHDS